MSELELDAIEAAVPNGSDHNSTVISYHNIKYAVKMPKTCCRCFAKPETKEILKDVSGKIKVGINAIMGPTGSGKSSLLDVLAKRKDPKWLDGKVLLKGQKLPKNYKYISGYVVQNDILIGTLTVRECLWFSANLRLSSDTTPEKKKNRVTEILEQLGLEMCADTRIGNEYFRGISGGERKRTSIALELITSPEVLFLDEPTTGLDSATASSIMNLLKDISIRGAKTIVLSIHQPRFNIFRLFDTLTILSHGHCVYHGPANETLHYFESVGYNCEPHNNPADFFLDVVNGLVSQVNVENEEASPKHIAGLEIAQELCQEFQKSDLFQYCSEDTTQNEAEEGDGSQGIMCATSFWNQLKYLLKRDFSNIIRNPQGLLGNIIINILISLIFGVIYFDLDNSPIKGTQNRFGLLFFVTTNLLFGSINVIELLMKSRSLFIHEYVSGYYHIASYFLAKLLADIVPMRTMAPIAYAVVTYWMAGLRKGVQHFFIFLLVSILTGYAAVGVGVFFSASFQTFAVASLLMVLVFIFSIVFSGLLVNIESIVKWLAWLRYLSIARFSIVGLSVNEFNNQNFTQCFSENGAEEIGTIIGSAFIVTNDKNNSTCISISGNSFLEAELSVLPGNADLNGWVLWQNVVALACIAVGMYFLTYIQLVRMKKYS